MTKLYGFAWSYDGAGNRKNQDRDGADSYYYYDQANQLLRIESNGALTYFQYDDNGNTIAEQTADGTTYYHYTPENRLSKVLSDIGGSTPNYFYYDGDQRRIISEDSQGRTYFLYDAEKVAVEKNAAGTTQAAYMNQGPSIYEPLIYMDRAGTKSYHLFNHLGTTLALASSAEALTDTYRRNAWGVELASTRSTTNRFGYVGRLGYYQEPDQPGDYSTRLRIIRAGQGRWVTRDPLLVTSRCYVYVDNDPAYFVGPAGAMTIIPPFLDPTPFIDAYESEKCGVREGKKLSAHYGPMKANDKWKHCALACKLRQKCGSPGAWVASIGKEFKDLFTAHNAEWGDLAADNTAIGIGNCPAADCEKECDKHYPKHPPKQTPKKGKAARGAGGVGGGYNPRWGISGTPAV